MVIVRKACDVQRCQIGLLFAFNSLDRYLQLFGLLEDLFQLGVGEFGYAKALPESTCKFLKYKKVEIRLELGNSYMSKLREVARLRADSNAVFCVFVLGLAVQS